MDLLRGDRAGVNADLAIVSCAVIRVRPEHLRVMALSDPRRPRLPRTATQRDAVEIYAGVWEGDPRPAWEPLPTSLSAGATGSRRAAEDDGIDFAAYMPDLIRHYGLTPNDSLSDLRNGNLCFGNKGSLKIDVNAGTWYDFEASQGGGVLDFILFQEPDIKSKAAAAKWFKETFINGSEPRNKIKTKTNVQLNKPPKEKKLYRSKTIESCEAIYPYTDEAGALLYNVVRYPKGAKKKFKQCRPDVDGGWIWASTGVRKVLFRLPKILKAIASQKTIYIAEGEKDALTLVNMGFEATTNCGGALTWLNPEADPPYRDSLLAADVVIIPDNDPQARNKDGSLRFHPDGRPYHTGEVRVPLVANDLIGIAKRVRVLWLPKQTKGGGPLKDITNWVEDGGTANELNALVEAQAKIWVPILDDNVAVAQSPEIPLKEKAPPAPGNVKPLLTAATLQTMLFPAIKYLLPGLVPEGATLLVARPKIGKSWMVLDIAVAVATGESALGTVKAGQGDVLYLALEDGPRRLQSRLTKLLSPFLRAWPDNLYFQTEWSRQDQGGLEGIENWIKTHPAARLVIIDTLAQFRPKSTGKETMYTADYTAVAGLQKLASTYNIAIMIVHHDRKANADDPFDTVSGTLGITGAADTILIIKRNSAGTTLYVRGRDIEEAEKAIQLDATTLRWTILGDAAAVNRSNERKRILELLRQNGEPMGPTDIAEGTGMKNANVRYLIRQMTAAGEVMKDGRGKYKAVEAVDSGGRSMGEELPFERK